MDNDLKDLKLEDYQIIAFYNALDVTSLKNNFPGFKQNGTKFVAFGAGIRKAMREAGLSYAIGGPTPEFPALADALDKLIKDPDFKQTNLPEDPVEKKAPAKKAKTETKVKAATAAKKKEEAEKPAAKAPAKKATAKAPAKKTAAAKPAAKAPVKKTTVKAPAKKAAAPAKSTAKKTATKKAAKK